MKLKTTSEGEKILHYLEREDLLISKMITKAKTKLILEPVLKTEI